MTWHCSSCGTTLTYMDTSMSAFTAVPAGMLKCPRCDKWMDRVNDEDGG